jgi:hypothetical protein
MEFKDRYEPSSYLVSKTISDFFMPVFVAHIKQVLLGNDILSQLILRVTIKC